MVKILIVEDNFFLQKAIHGHILQRPLLQKQYCGKEQNNKLDNTVSFPDPISILFAHI
jgi:hypothetical protein